MTAHNNDSLRSPLGRARGLGSAKDGTHHWIVQRVTAVALIPLVIFLLTQLPHIVMTDRASVIAWLQDPVIGIALALFIVTAFYHAMLGLQVVIEDYIHTPVLKYGALLLNQISFFFLGMAGLYAAIRLTFGA